MTSRKRTAEEAVDTEPLGKRLRIEAQKETTIAEFAAGATPQEIAHVLLQYNNGRGLGRGLEHARHVFRALLSRPAVNDRRLILEPPAVSWHLTGREDRKSRDEFFYPYGINFVCPYLPGLATSSGQQETKTLSSTSITDGHLYHVDVAQSRSFDGLPEFRAVAGTGTDEDRRRLTRYLLSRRPQVLEIRCNNPNDCTSAPTSIYSCRVLMARRGLPRTIFQDPEMPAWTRQQRNLDLFTRPEDLDDYFAAADQTTQWTPPNTMMVSSSPAAALVSSSSSKPLLNKMPVPTTPLLSPMASPSSLPPEIEPIVI